jgi:hypothetical protein
LRLLIAKTGFTFDRRQTFLESREPAIGGAAGKIRAPLGALRLSLFSALRLSQCRSAWHIADKKNPNDRQRRSQGKSHGQSHGQSDGQSRGFCDLPK